VLVVLALNYLYIHTRDHIGYLLVILPFAFVPVAIWSAISSLYVAIVALAIIIGWMISRNLYWKKIIKR
jgi:VIT1/CCC1 family predicted Fe2+/Mn2+ transporter